MNLLIESLKNNSLSNIYMSIEYLKKGDGWISTNGNMLFHLINNNGVHVEGYYFMGMGNEGLRLIGMVRDRNIDRSSWLDIGDAGDGILKIIGVDII